jgi:hypothetical protein
MRRYRTLLQTPLRQLMVLLWLAGLILMAGRLGQPLLDGSWAISAALGALVTLAVAGAYRVSVLLLLALLLGLGAVLAALRAFGADTPLILGLATFLYAGLSWRFVTVAASHSLTRRIADFLHWDLGLDTAAGQRWIEHATQWTTFFITLITVGFMLRPVPETYLHGTALAGLGVGAAIIHDMGLFYRLRVHSFLVLAFAAKAAWLLWMPERLEAASLPGEARALTALFFGLSALALWVGGCLLDFRAAITRNAGPLADSLYRQPLRQAGILASLFGATTVTILLDPGAPAGNVAAWTLALSALGLLLSNHALRYPGLDLLALYGGAVVLWWLGMHGEDGGTSFRPGFGHRNEGWVLSLLVLGGSLGSRTMGLSTRLAGRYPPLLNTVALTGFALALWISLSQVPEHPPFGDAFVSWTLAVLAFGLLFLHWPLPFPLQSQIRGIGFVLLITAALAGFWAASPLDSMLRWGALSWAFILWFLAEFLLPRVHLRWPHWAIAGDSWPWIGMILIGVNLLAGAEDASGWAGLLLVAALYLFLMLRLTSVPLLAWFAVLFLTGAGLAGLIALLEEAPPELSGEYSLRLFAAGAILWANLLFSVARYCQGREEQSAPNGIWRTNQLALSFDCAFYGVAGWVFLLLTGIVALSSAPLILGRPLPLAADWFSLVLLSSLVGLSFVRSFLVKLHSALIHASIAAFLCAWLAGFFALGAHLIVPPSLALSTGAGVMLLANLPLKKWPRIGQILDQWTQMVLLTAIAAGFMAPDLTLGNGLIVLAVNCGLSAILSYRLLNAVWLYGAFALFVLLLHDWPRLWVDDVEALLPWYALQLSLLAWLFSGWRPSFLNRNEPSPIPEENPLLEFAALLRNCWPSLVVLAAGELVLHGLSLAETLKYAPPPRGTAELMGSAAALLAGLSLLAQGISRLRVHPNSVWIYALILLALSMGVYVRLLAVGLQPLGLADTAGFILGAYLLTIIHRVTTSVPVLRVATWLPLMAPFTVSLQLASMDSTVMFLAMGMLYCWMCRSTEKRLPLYLGLIFFNAAVYLWAPTWVSQTRLLQIYIVPASISVLVLLHLHRKELKPSVLNTTRLAATGTLYASATLDIFLNNSALSVFVLALALSMSGIVIGIALRIRAFLFTGVSFMVLDIAGQLLNLYPEDRLGRAIVLMTLGGSIIGAMIWFNIKREAILKQIGIIRADLESWQ